MVVERVKRTIRWEYRKARSYLDSTRTVSAGGTEATIKTDTIQEYLRAQNLKGEEDFVSQMISKVDADDIVWDIGANVGTHSLLLAPSVAEVIAFEPHPLTAARLMENVEINDAEVEVMAFALGDSEDIIPLRLPDDSVEDVGVGTFTTVGDGTIDVTVAQKRANRLVSNELVPSPDVLKIDVEGGELGVLRGFDERLTDIETVFCEVHPRFVEPSKVVSILEKGEFEVDYMDERESEVHIVGRGI